jgi:glycosyltransferase involved in cell wall biosynthesis
MNIKVAAFTGSKTISSRRFRVSQYVNLLKEQEITIIEHYSKFGSWPPVKLIYRPFWLILTLIDRVLPIIKSFRSDIIFFQRELVSTLLTFEFYTKRPRVLDVDDAIWLQNSRAHRNFIKLAAKCDGIICGNDYIFNFLKSFNSNCIIIPTSVDTNRFKPFDIFEKNDNKIIGWSGLSSGFKFLYDIENELNQVLNSHPSVRLRIVSDLEPKFKEISKERIEYVKWTPENEVLTIQNMTIGIMPIDNTEWSKGKCSYKMLLYMSCAIPVVVSNFGMNKEVLDKGNVGFGCNTNSDWVINLNKLLENQDLAIEMGKNGRKIIVKYYSLSSNAFLLSNFLKSIKLKN